MSLEEPVRHHHLKAYGRSAAHGLYVRQHDNKKLTPAMERGKCVDALIYGTMEVIRYEGEQRRGKEYQELKLKHPNAHILLPNDYDLVMGMVNAIRNCKEATPWLKGIHQETLYFNYNGIVCRATPDTRGDGFLTELKCTNNSGDRKFPWHLKNMHYPVQMWMQRLACEANPVPHYATPERLLIVAVEDTPPHVVTVFEIMPSLQDEAAKTLMLWSEKLKVAEAAKVWPGYSTAIVEVEADQEAVELDFGDE